MSHPMPPGVIDPDTGEAWEFNAPFPVPFDRAYLKYRDDLELFAESLRSWWRNQQAQPIPIAEYEDGKLEYKWDGKMHPVSKPFHTWLTKSSYHKSDQAPRVLVATLVAHGEAAQRSKKG